MQTSQTRLQNKAPKRKKFKFQILKYLNITIALVLTIRVYELHFHFGDFCAPFLQLHNGKWCCHMILQEISIFIKPLYPRATLRCMPLFDFPSPNAKCSSFDCIRIHVCFIWWKGLPLTWKHFFLMLVVGGVCFGVYLSFGCEKFMGRSFFFFDPILRNFAALFSLLQFSLLSLDA